MTETNPLDYIHQTAVYQLRHAADEIEDDNGLVADFDYDEEPPEVEFEGGVNYVTGKSPRTVTLELTYYLPE